MKTTIRVLQEDIDAGDLGDCYRCPVALALQRATGDMEAEIYQTSDGLRLKVGGASIVAPDAVRHFVHQFDDGEVCEPFTFEIPRPSDPQWREECYGCEELFAPADLDSEGYCASCTTGGLQ
jgi:Zn finger protein HypA/HybF involved in hydrogenase expression